MRASIAGAAAAAALLLGHPAVEAQTAASVSIVNSVPTAPCANGYSYCFTPASVTVDAGGTVAWSSSSSAPHTVSADDGSFNSGSISAGGTYRHTFTTPGTYTYHCSIHPYMTASVKVNGTTISQSMSSSTVAQHSSTSTAVRTATPRPATSAPTPSATAPPSAAAPVAAANTPPAGDSSSTGAAQATSSAVAATPAPSGGGSSGGVVAGVAVGLLAVGGGAVWWRRRRPV